MTPLRKQMIDDMIVRGLAEQTQYAYLRAVTGLSPERGRTPMSWMQRLRYVFDIELRLCPQ